MSDRLVLWEYRTERVGSTTLHRGAAGVLNSFSRNGWELLTMIDAEKFLNVLGGEKMVAVLRRPLPHPDPPTDKKPGWRDCPLDLVAAESLADDENALVPRQRWWDGNFWTIHTHGYRDHRLEKLGGYQEASDGSVVLNSPVFEGELVHWDAPPGTPAKKSPKGWYPASSEDPAVFKYYNGRWFVDGMEKRFGRPSNESSDRA